MNAPVRGSDVFLKEDLRAILAAIVVVNRRASAAYSLSTDYDEGFNTAMIAVAVSVGIDPSEIAPGRP